MSTATAPIISDPILISVRDLTSNPALTSQVATLANAAFTRAHAALPERWDFPVLRFPNTDAVLAYMQNEEIMAVVLDESKIEEEIAVEVQDGSGKQRKGKLIACAVALPWSGGWEGEGKGKEEGWEFKAVCVDGDERYLKKGIATKVCQALEDYLIVKEREKLNTGASSLTEAGQGEKKGVLKLWLLAAEDLSSEYWKKKGFTEVRRKEYEKLWHCKGKFDMLVLQKDVPFSSSSNE